jgi:hypothetical protein
MTCFVFSGRRGGVWIVARSRRLRRRRVDAEEFLAKVGEEAAGLRTRDDLLGLSLCFGFLTNALFRRVPGLVECLGDLFAEPPDLPAAGRRVDVLVTE